MLDHLQCFLKFDDCLPLRMTLVIASDVATSHIITRGSKSDEFGVHWSLVG